MFRPTPATFRQVGNKERVRVIMLQMWSYIVVQLLEIIL